MDVWEDEKFRYYRDGLQYLSDVHIFDAEEAIMQHVAAEEVLILLALADDPENIDVWYAIE